MTTKPTYEELEQRIAETELALQKIQGRYRALLEHMGRGVVTSSDETERRPNLEALKESQEELSEIFEMSLDLICVADINTATFLKVNPAFTRLLGYSEQELLNRSFLDFIHPEDVIPTLTVIEEKLKKGENAVNFTNRYRSSSGDYLWLKWASKPIPERGVTFAVAHDVTELKKVEEALRESESTLESVFTAAPVGICLMKNRVYQRANRNWCESFGYPEPSLIGRTPAFLYESREEYERVGKELYGHPNKDGITSARTRLKRSDGEIRDVVLIAKPLDPKDPKAGTVTVVHDLTGRTRAEEERERLENQLHQSQKMESLGTLAGGIAHDFNNLLMAIQGRISLMLLEKDASHPDAENLKEIERYVGSAAGLTRQLLGFAKGGKYETKPTNLNDLIKRENRMFGRTKKEVTIHEKCDDNLWYVAVDRGQIQQVILNIYVNAWQAMPNGGNLHVRTGNVTLDEDFINPHGVAPGPYVQISVTDTGIGMDETTLGRIFDPFFTTKDLNRGTGLGMASAYGIIKNHGGFINVYSEKGHGSTFHIYLPACRKEIVEEKKPAKETIRGSGVVLFVDDEKMITETLEDLLGVLGYKVLLAGSGKEALRIYEKNKELIDIVILDMIMPDMGGAETYESLKKLDPHVKVLLSSGYSVSGQATEILNRGANGFIQKPFKLGELSEKLREILG